jgi:hypothetical protein
MSEPGTQRSQAESAATIEQIKSLTADNFGAWIQKKLTRPLNPKDLKALKDVNFGGEAFLMLAKDPYSFPEGVQLSSFAIPAILAQLAGEIAGRDAVSAKGKLLSFTPCTPCRRPANDLTGNRQQAEDVEMSAAGKSTDHAPLFFLR